MTKKTDSQGRLQEITDKLGDLSDDEVLHLLAERKQLEELKHQYERIQAELGQAQEERTHIEKELARLNTLISPDKPDDELIHLVEERRVLEGKLETALAEVARLEATPDVAPVAKTPQEEVAPAAPAVSEEPVREREITPVQPEVVLVAEPEPVKLAEEVPQPEKSHQAPVDDSFGREAIKANSLEGDSDLARALDRIKNDPESIGRILEDLPPAMRRNKQFMLAVAEVDSAYAMHYADKDTLKKDADFNLKVVKFHNERRSGSVLTEMLPEARTAQIVAVAIKFDYRNVRFLQPQMEGYDEILESAKKGTLEKVKELKNSVDIEFLVPKILQKDSAFMKQVAALAPSE